MAKRRRRLVPLADGGTLRARLWPYLVAPLLLGSGACALVYQTVWFREFRLIFGGSTPSAAAVLAVFAGGLGVGGLVLGKRADRHPRPLVLYAKLEALVALAAALTPLVLWFIGRLYIAVGGANRLGDFGATVARIFLTILVLGVPTFLMGGTLPAAVRSAESEGDAGRRTTGLLYGINTLGAVLGVVVATFFLLGALGNRMTLWTAAGANLFVALAARALAHFAEDEGPHPERAPPPTTHAPATAAVGVAPPEWFALAAAAAVGFVFFLMELVWYRMLGSLLGATVFTLGLILALALLGIGLGGVFYVLWGRLLPPTLPAFALTCLLEGAALAVPFALGDRIAIWTIELQPNLDHASFYELVKAWGKITAVVVVPASFAAGVQFPVLIGLLGRGRAAVGQHLGLAYAFNTGGAILGSLAGGFGFLPLFGAPGCWRAAIVMLAAMALGAVVLWARPRRRILPLFPAAVGAALVAATAFATGPTAAWRHSSIGAYRVGKTAVDTPRKAREFINDSRRAIEWEKDGREASVALQKSTGYSFFVNGKADGHVMGDAATQVMGPLVGAILHGRVKNALVIGLGTGSSAGWLGAIPGIERVDVLEIEPIIKHVARTCAPANHDVLANPKVHVIIGDARESLLTNDRKYDLIFSEPSNPSRAGIANLFTREYYYAVADRLNEGGVFLQWLQGYEVDTQTGYTVFATVGSIFPEIETWHLMFDDLLLVATMKPMVHDTAAIRARVAAEPFRAALANAWRTSGLEGFFSHHVGQPSLARMIAAQEGDRITTDDLNLVEFGFSQLAGSRLSLKTAELLAVSKNRKEEHPRVSGVAPDWTLVDEQGKAFQGTKWKPSNKRAEPVGLGEIASWAWVLADQGDEKARPYIEEVARHQPVQADALMGILRFAQKRYPESADWLEASFAGYRKDPWPDTALMRGALNAVKAMARAADKDTVRRLFEAVKTPFVLRLLDDPRMETAMRLTEAMDLKEVCAEAVGLYEPHVPWTRKFLDYRARCYTEVGHPLARRAAADLATFEKQH